jgi:3-hydroxyisobutyrate dehydrogenase-like beta-hydroxyacid dehydrogenase
MAANIARAGHPLTVFNRTAEKAKPLRELGAGVADSPAAVASSSEIVITMLSDAAAVERLLFGEEGVVSAQPGGLVVIDMSTIAPDQSQRHAQQLASASIQMVDAPVYGSTGPAEQGTLGIMAGGDQDLVKELKPLLTTMGSVFYLGPSGSGALAKMCFNLMVAGQMVSLAEAMALGNAGGLDLKTLGAIISGSGISSNFIERKIANIVADSFDPAFPLKHMQKDLGLMVRTSDKLGVSLPATGLLQQLFTAARERGLADHDLAAIYRLLNDRTGLAR